MKTLFERARPEIHLRIAGLDKVDAYELTRILNANIYYSALSVRDVAFIADKLALPTCIKLQYQNLLIPNYNNHEYETI